MPQLSDQDLNLLNSYLDRRLSDRERAAVESRLASDEALRAELEALRATIGLLQMAERVPVPRNFTLDPATAAQMARRPLWDRLGIGTLPGWVFAGASLAVALVCIGAVIVSGGLGGAPAASVALQPAAQSSGERAAAPAAGLAAEAPTEMAVAPPEAAIEAPAAAATEAQSFAPVAPSLATPGPAALAPAPEAGAAQPGVLSGGQAGQAAANSSPLPQPTQSIASAAQAATPAVASDNAAAKSNTGGGPAASDEFNPAPSETLVGPQNLAATAPSATPARIPVVEAQPFEGLKVAGWIILVAGTLGLLALVLAVTLLMRRRR